MKLITTNHKDGSKSYSFTCPGCRRHHAIRVGNAEGPSWTFDGNLDKPTFSPSILNRVLLTGGGHRDRCHFFIRDGRIEFCGESEHKLAGQTVDLPDIEASEQ